ncbi:hypothetical protein [Afifella marina]|uniref:Uncharacterized protein n=1 Tax=Afifella marina DSM 2698 TaxID=1120955 RepID=A0A1G5M8I5_AFIMA|nr:hypothetical protein [Afifella marina]SCZ21416.1 hypothetical protein SAMN03080610_00262 [Afifella marina DSM 2698]
MAGSLLTDWTRPETPLRVPYTHYHSKYLASLMTLQGHDECSVVTTIRKSS